MRAVHRPSSLHPGDGMARRPAPQPLSTQMVKVGCLYIATSIMAWRSTSSWSRRPHTGREGECLPKCTPGPVTNSQSPGLARSRRSSRGFSLSKVTEMASGPARYWCHPHKSIIKGGGPTQNEEQCFRRAPPCREVRRDEAAVGRRAIAAISLRLTATCAQIASPARARNSFLRAACP